VKWYITLGEFGPEPDILTPFLVIGDRCGTAGRTNLTSWPGQTFDIGAWSELMIATQHRRRIFRVSVTLGLAMFLGSLSAAESGDEGATSQDQQPTPNDIIGIASAAISAKLDGRQDYLKENPDELYTQVNDILLPYFDARYAGRLALGKHWRDATAEQRDEFVEAFYQFLIQSYADGILDFDRDSITIFPRNGELDNKRAVVKTEMQMPDGSDVPVNYSMRNSSGGWRVYDVRIEGVSYIQNYRNQFNAEITALGIEAVIIRLRDEAERARNPAAS
jgi:phospholipid transport system substrate-binding protein